MGRIQLAMEKVAKNDGIMVVHAEDDDIVQFNYERFAAEGRTDGTHLVEVHTKLSEGLAFDRIIRVASVTGAAVYFVHTSAREGVEAVTEARGHGRRPVYCGTLHQYALFSAEDYKKPRGFCHHTYPSLKYPDDHKSALPLTLSKKTQPVADAGTEGRRPYRATLVGEMTAERERQLSRHRRRCAQRAEIETSDQIATLVEELYY